MSVDLAVRIRRWVVVATAAIMGVELVFVLINAQWLNALLMLAIMAIVLGPTLLGPRLPVAIPAEFQVLAIVFVFSALFLGEVRSYYERFWWWDIVLHTSSGLMLGLLGFLLVYVLNENERADLHMRPRFVALFAFLIVDTVGAAAISGFGWWYMHRKEHSFIENWIRKFIARNPQLFDG